MATGQTTNFNIPYPVSTDPVNVHSDMQSLAQSVDTLLNSGVRTSAANAFTNINTFSANSASSAITITQTGAGNALTVEDSSPDSTPFIINASGNVGIGKSTASVPLDVVGAGTFTGTVTANDFAGIGTNLTALNGTNITSGTIVAGRIESTIARVASPTFTGTVTVPTGVRFVAGTNLITPVAGALEYDGTNFYATPASIRSATPNTFIFKKPTSTSIISLATAQSILATGTTASASTGIALASGTTYEFEVRFVLSTTGTTSHTEGVGFFYSGTTSFYSYEATRTLANIASSATTYAQIASGTTLTSNVINTTITPAITTSQTNAIYVVKGWVTTNTAGNWTPTLIFSAAPGTASTIAAGTTVKITPYQSSTGTVNISTWA